MDGKLSQVILWHSGAYPYMEPADYVKLLYQNEFGCSHLTADPDGGFEQLKKEFVLLPVSPETGERGSRMEGIGNGLCRIFLRRGPRSEEFLPLLGRMGAATARTHLGNGTRLQQKLELLRNMASQGQLRTSREDMDSFLQKYADSGCGPVHHSDAYREHYSPHYRVVRAAYYFYLPVLEAAMKLMSARSGKGPAILALDGRCGSGKSFLAGILQEVFGCSVFHMDDFYLPRGRRAGDWKSQTGGNIDRERFLREVLVPLRRGENVLYRPYSCMRSEMLPPREIRPGKLAVVEGTYSVHPDFRGYYDYGVFLTCLNNVQQRRIFLRSGGDRLYDFLEYWIPAEERYFEAEQTLRFCNLTLDTSAFEDLT